VKTIIAGSRSITDYDLLLEALTLAWEPTEVICGGAPGVDYLGLRWAREHDVPVTLINADWARIGKVAGMLRNREMAKLAEGLIAVWDGKSPGTHHMIKEARRHGLTIYIYVPHRQAKQMASGI
jgi:YspA, cpYpsA-related SLOG family